MEDVLHLPVDCSWRAKELLAYVLGGRAHAFFSAQRIIA
jgi:hypothetical protein